MRGPGLEVIETTPLLSATRHRVRAPGRFGHALVNGRDDALSRHALACSGRRNRRQNIAAATRPASTSLRIEGGHENSPRIARQSGADAGVRPRCHRCCRCVGGNSGNDRGWSAARDCDNATSGFAIGSTAARVAIATRVRKRERTGARLATRPRSFAGGDSAHLVPGPLNLGAGRIEIVSGFA